MSPSISDTERRTDGRESARRKTRRQNGESVLEHAVPAREATVCVVGLGYVGLPLAAGFARANYRVIGYDIDVEKVARLSDGVETADDLPDGVTLEGDVSVTADASAIGEADYVIVAVPTPVDEDERPDLEYVEQAATSVGTHLQAGTTVILESTIYPGATRGVFLPALERASGLRAGEDFFVGYSPERATPGDDDHGLEDVVKVVSGQDETVLDDVAALYESVVDAGVHRAPSIEVAEASKVVENAQRDVNIAFVNEVSMALDRMGVDAAAVLEAARTKWNFHDYRPGLVGGHCIPVDPYFLAHRAKRAGFEPELLLAGRRVNESMPRHVAESTIKALNRCNRTLRESRVLVLGLAYKPGVGDIRSTKVADVVAHLREFDIEVAGYDPHVEADDVREAFDIDVLERLSFDGFDAVILATPHAAFDDVDLDEMVSSLAAEPAVIDVTGALDPDALPDDVGVYWRV